MINETKKRTIGFDADSASELAEMLDRFYDEHQGDKVEVVFCGKYGLSAILSFDETTKKPETLREEYELRGEVYTCADCPHRQPITDGRKRSKWYCTRRPRGTDLDASACNHFYLELEGEDE